MDSVKASCEALYKPEHLVELIRANTPQANDVRLRLRMEIRKRVE